MHNSFYASGFLYNLKTQQILLLQSEQKDDKDLKWTLLGGEGREGEQASDAFKRIVLEKLNINLKSKNIFPVYDYPQEKFNKINYVFYAEVKKTPKFGSQKNGTLSWVTFTETAKLPFYTQSKQDVIVGQRVINAKWRTDEGII